MSLFRLVFPEKNRSFPGKRWLNVIFRSIHICGVVAYSGGVFFDAPFSQLGLPYAITAISGLAIIALDVYGNGVWLIQNRGWMIILKLLALGVLHRFETYEKIGLMVVIIISSIVSHGTANFRYYSVYHRKRTEFL